jgi:hypothetical protein
MVKSAINSQQFFVARKKKRKREKKDGANINERQILIHPFEKMRALPSDSPMCMMGAVLHRYDYGNRSGCGKRLSLSERHGS